MAGHGLGRGFESLIPTELSEDFDPTIDDDKAVSKLKELDVDEIVRDESQPRRNFDEESLNALADSIREHGILQPIVVTKVGDKYQIVAGERRWRAAKIAELKTIPSIIRTLDAQNRLELSIIENAQREDLNAVELATAYAKLRDQFNMTAKEIGEKVGKSESSIMNTMRLLSLPDIAKKAMVEHKLSEGVMRPLVTAEPELVEKAVPLIIAEGWTARKVEQYVSLNKKRSSTRVLKTNVYARQEESLGKRFNAKVRVNSRSVTFSCKNEQELAGLIERLGQ
ncbi:ParB/RepB/Spo0J family partition protein [Candidatus Saccharibacteria bacterium]|nr:ParB/RepB/Spo0J family partition protein [Candidatus Saccharibacteria bacterium]